MMLTDAQVLERSTPLLDDPLPLPDRAGPAGAVPPPAPLAMPKQALDRWDGGQAAFPREAADLGTRLMRVLAFGGTLALTLLAVREMIQVVTVSQITLLQWPLVALFAVTFAWIAFSAMSAITGAASAGLRLLRRQPGEPTTRPEAQAASLDPAPRTALVMPIYNEDPAAVFARLAAMAEELADLPEADAFEFFILSDTRDPDLWVAEERAFLALRRQHPDLPAWYRRRPDNVGRKAGNVEEFVTRWGGRYAHMVVLDADSLMTGAAIAALRQAMLDDPQAGIIQTSPRLIGGHSLLARLQQFATRIYGPVVSDGIAAWQGRDGNYWGHNAIIRVAAFATAAGLPDLPGPRPFGGAILSHDFVEAALIRRAGWRVTMLPRIEGSYEGVPPSLIDLAIRDRRWTQGNLQHAGVLAARGLRGTSRCHLANGILSYLMSPIWLALLLVGLALAVQARFIRPDYFAVEHALFPTWPQFDSVAMIQLLVLSAAVLLLPKVLGVLRGLLHGPTRRGCGGGLTLVASALVEILVSSILAPIMMMLQTRFVAQILSGQDSGWGPQRRDDGAWPLRRLFTVHWGHALMGIALTALALSVVPSLAAWMAPALLGLVLAIPLSAASGSVRLGRLAGRLGLLRIPEEADPPRVLSRALTLQRQFAEAAAKQNGLAALMADDEALALHLSALNPQPRPRGQPDPHAATAEAKLRDADSFEELLGWLSAPERLAVLGDPRLLLQIRTLTRRPAGMPGWQHGQHGKRWHAVRRD